MKTGRTMHKLYHLTGLIFLTHALYGCDENTNNKQTLEALQQKASYSYGADIASRLKQQGLEFDTNAFTRGIADAYMGSELAINDESRTQAKTDYQKKIRKNPTAELDDDKRMHCSLVEEKLKRQGTYYSDPSMTARVMEFQGCY